MSEACLNPSTMRKLSQPRFIAFCAVVFLFLFIAGFQYSSYVSEKERLRNLQRMPTPRMVIVVTPTYKRFTRIPDMIRMANTLSHVEHLHWIVIEDGNMTVPAVENILGRSGLSYTYMAHMTAAGYPRKGWYQRTQALKFIRSNTSQILGDSEEGVLYFGDDDNSYDIRLFTEYIRNVKKLGMWAVGYVGGGLVEAPKVANGVFESFDVKWGAKRKFAVDMAGFAVNLKVVLKSDAVFGTSCKRGLGAPETCLLEDMGLEKVDIEPFGWQGTKDREIYVWHTKTNDPYIDRRAGEPNSFGYLVET